MSKTFKFNIAVVCESAQSHHCIRVTGLPSVGHKRLWCVSFVAPCVLAGRCIAEVIIMADEFCFFNRNTNIFPTFRSDSRGERDIKLR